MSANETDAAGYSLGPASDGGMDPRRFADAARLTPTADYLALADLMRRRGFHLESGDHWEDIACVVIAAGYRTGGIKHSDPYCVSHCRPGGRHSQCGCRCDHTTPAPADAANPDGIEQ